MSLEVCVANMDLAMALPAAPAAGSQGFVAGLVGALERELDRRMPSPAEVIVIPQLEFELECPVLGDSELLEELARQMAERIALAAGESHWRVSFPLSATSDACSSAPVVSSAAMTSYQSTLYDLALGAASGQSWEELQKALEPERPEAAVSGTIEQLFGGGEPLRLLGKFARLGRLPDLARQIDREKALAILRLVREAIHVDVAAGSTARQTIAAAAWWAETVASTERLVAAAQRPSTLENHAHATAAMVCVLAIAEVVRLGPAAVYSSPSMRTVISEAVDHLFSTNPAGQPPPCEPAPDSPGVNLTVSPEFVLKPAVILSGARTEEFKGRTEARTDEATVDEEFRWQWTQAGGLGFLVGALIDLGLWEALQAIRGEPGFAVYWILRRILVREAPHLAGDPAAPVLAGLLAMPDDADRRREMAGWSGAAASALARAASSKADTPIGAFDAWATSAVAEVRSRLGETGDAGSIRGLIALDGMLAEDEHGLELTLPYPTQYRALLLGGLLTDLENVPWLGGRSLRFIFQQ